MKLLQIVVFYLFISSCNNPISELEKIMDESNKIQKIIESNCDCDMVGFYNFEKDNALYRAHIEIVGANPNLKTEILQNINTVLKDSISDYCEIDEFKFDFINKLKHDVKIVRHCEIEE